MDSGFIEAVIPMKLPATYKIYQRMGLTLPICQLSSGVIAAGGEPLQTRCFRRSCPGAGTNGMSHGKQRVDLEESTWPR